MADSTLAGIITAVATVLTSISLVIGALTLFLPILRGTRENKKAIKEVHTIVNQQRTDSLRYQRALIKALEKHGVEVPEDQSIASDEEPEQVSKP
jgi:hypothetical protein